MEPKNYCSPTEFSRRSGLSVVTVRRYLRSGLLPFVQLGGRRHCILIPCDAIERFQLPSTAQPSAEADPSSKPSKSAPLSGPVPRWLWDHSC
ncbi:helix-turn-helix domain-containing protein [Fimbriiglobus ruber]|uniref:Helix-turn-helix domain-containing protein n=1 Tax=Fimbriiglobus ruber TaxID=1908690 RepID=A0A225DDY6_9BACT|nr:hypothetical protein FRUB_05651 [Fimbriiglobus ruber]